MVERLAHNRLAQVRFLDDPLALVPWMGVDGMDIDTSSKSTRAAFYNSGAWKFKRREVLERDNFECQWCKDEGRVTIADISSLEVDHIKELADCPELALDDDNLRTLCKDCHNKRHSRMNYKHSNPKLSRWQDERWD